MIPEYINPKKGELMEDIMVVSLRLDKPVILFNLDRSAS